ncbi:MAG: enoyl-CoA hydratase/isomerase family protein [Acidimicrobiia bacterium]
MDTLTVERADGVVTVTMNRPARKNAATPQMFVELTEAFREVSADPTQRVLVITGAGDGFCSGADLANAAAGGGGGGARGISASMASMRVVGQCALALHQVPQPTIAAVNGVAAGAGCNLALGCDLIIASEQARFSEIFVKRGLNIDFGGSWILPRLIGIHKAKELAFLADIISAPEAAEVGIVNRVVPHDALMKEAMEVAQRLVKLPPIPLAMTKKLLNQSFAVSLTEALEFEDTSQAMMFGTKDTAEAVLAFIEKRDPHFTGE